MSVKRYFKLCNMYILLLLVMMGGGGGGRIRERAAEMSIPTNGDILPSRRRRAAEVSIPTNGGIPPSSKLSRASAINIIPVEAPFPLPTSGLESQIELSLIIPREREESNADSLAGVNT